MTKEEYLNAINDVIYLAGCVVNGQIPDKERIEKTNLEHLYQASQRHLLTAIVCEALKSAGIYDQKFHQAWAKSVRKVTAMQIDMELLFAEMEKEKIWYMPLKGTVLKDFYPSIGLRQMADFDILFDKAFVQKVCNILITLGFTCEEFGKGNHDVYHKQPVSNFEMHKELFGETHKKEIYEYYHNIRPRLIKDEGNQYGYHFSNEDLYIYLTAHEYKHFSSGGTGLRSVLDIYVFWQKFGSQLDTDYITAETQKMGISDFEQQNRLLSLHLFGNKELTKTDHSILKYIISSGTYGTLQHGIESKINKYGSQKKGKRAAFLMNRLFLPLDEVKAYYPFYYKHKILLPALAFHRLIKALTVNRKKTISTLKILKKIK